MLPKLGSSKSIKDPDKKVRKSGNPSPTRFLKICV